MKTCLIVGTDSIGAAGKLLKENYGIQRVIHWTGRKARPPTRLPRKVSMVIVVAGYINHNFARRVKELTKGVDIQVKYVSRGLSGLKNDVMEG